MNREIEFRVWDKYKKKMYPVSDIMFDIFKEEIFNLSVGLKDGLNMSYTKYHRDEEYDTDALILMQYTVLKDKNGKKIFEGDIIIAHDTKFIVKFGAYRTQLFEKKYGSAIHTKQFGWYAESIENKEQCNLVIPNDIEVIGNIYENNLESKGE